MKIALCIAGQIRQDNAAFNNLAVFARKHSAEVFISTWRKPGTKSSGVINQDQAYRMFGKIFGVCLPLRFVSGQNLLLLFPNFTSKVNATISPDGNTVCRSDILRLFPKSIIEIEDEEELHLEFNEKYNDNNSLKMLYKIWRCNELKRAYERKNRFKFDIVVRTRPDCVPSELKSGQYLFLEQERRVIYVDQVRENFVGDSFFITDSKTADYYAGLFGKAILEPTRPWAGIHRELFSHLFDVNIEQIPHPFGYSLETDSLRQRQNRDVLLEMISVGDFVSDTFADDRERGIITVSLKIANLLENGNTEDAYNLMLISKNLLHVDPCTKNIELIFPILSVLGEIYYNKNQFINSFIANFLALILRSSQDLSSISKSHPSWTSTIQSLVAVFSEQDISFPITFSVVKELMIKANILCVCIDKYMIAINEEWDDITQKILEQINNVCKTSTIFRESLFNRAKNLLHREDNLNAAAEAARRLITIDQRDWRGHDVLGHCYERMGDPEGALRCAQVAAEVNPDFGALHSRVGYVLLYALNRPAEAEPHLQRGAELWQASHAWRWLGDALVRQGRHSEADRVFAQADKSKSGTA